MISLFALLGRLVAPYIGAWIETPILSELASASSVAPYIGAWIETWCLIRSGTKDTVAPYIGTWIETSSAKRSTLTPPSHLTQVRGLKQLYHTMIYDDEVVAPYTGAWIETKNALNES